VFDRRLALLAFPRRASLLNLLGFTLALRLNATQGILANYACVRSIGGGKVIKKI
jgi:hypothetical protein